MATNLVQNPFDDYGKGKHKLDALRAAGKCFRCEETGHIARNCPIANTVPAHVAAQWAAHPTETDMSDKTHTARAKLHANRAHIKNFSSHSQQTILRCGSMSIWPQNLDSDSEYE